MPNTTPPPSPTLSTGPLQLSLGPVLFYWTRQRYADFYREAADWPVEIITLGETVCSRRRDMKLDDWLGIGRELTQAGKQVVLASQTLIESEADLRDLRKLCDNGDFIVEANDQSCPATPLQCRTAVHRRCCAQPLQPGDTGRYGPCWHAALASAGGNVTARLSQAY